jgi:hypothetical protein
MRSGMLVPAARIVSPMISVGMTNVSPIVFAHQTIRYEKAAIQKIEPTNVHGNHFFASLSIIFSESSCHMTFEENMRKHFAN